MVEEKQHALKDRETTEAWMTENSVSFHVSHSSRLDVQFSDNALIFDFRPKSMSLS